MSPDQQHVFGLDCQLVQEAVRSGVTSKRATSHDNHWERRLTFCHKHHLNPQLNHYSDPVPILQIFTQHYRDGRIALHGRPVKSRTAEDALRAMGQKFASLGTKDPRLDQHGKIDFRISRQLKCYKKTDNPPKRVKPVPITIILHILLKAHTLHVTEASRNVADMLTIAFYFLLCLGEHAGTKSEDHPFLIQDVTLYLGTRPLNAYTDPLHEVEAATSVSLTFTKQKNGVCNETISHGQSTHQHCCPVRAAIRLLIYHRTHNTNTTKPIATHYSNNNKLVHIAAKDITDQIKAAATATLRWDFLRKRNS